MIAKMWRIYLTSWKQDTASEGTIDRRGALLSEELIAVAIVRAGSFFAQPALFVRRKFIVALAQPIPLVLGQALPVIPLFAEILFVFGRETLPALVIALHVFFFLWA